MASIEIVTVGDELVEGRLIDTNSAHISDCLVSAGLTVVRHTSVPDDQDSIVTVLRDAASRADALVVSGGLGPTTDDLTARAAAAAFGLPIAQHPEALEHVERFFLLRGRTMPPNNRQQADLPAGCALIPNPNGTAVGFSVQSESCWCAFLPGVPRELEEMLHTTVLPELLQRFEADPPQIATLKLFGLGESDVGHRLDGIESIIGTATDLVVQYRASFPEIHVRFRLHGDRSAADLEAVVEEARRRLGPPVYAVGDARCDTTFAEVAARALRAADATVAFAEGLTAGRTISLFAVDETLMAPIAGAEVVPFGPDEALNRAWGVRSRFDTTFGCAVTGSPDDGLIRVAIAGPEDHSQKDLRFPIDADRLRTLAAHVAIARLLRAARDHS